MVLASSVVVYPRSESVSLSIIAAYIGFNASIVQVRSFLLFSAVFVFVYWATMGRKKEKAK